jgi:F0F1-type ATP synthase assembly protein I
MKIIKDLPMNELLNHLTGYDPEKERKQKRINKLKGIGIISLFVCGIVGAVVGFSFAITGQTWGAILMSISGISLCVVHFILHVND